MAMVLYIIAQSHRLHGGFLFLRVKCSGLTLLFPLHIHFLMLERLFHNHRLQIIFPVPPTFPYPHLSVLCPRLSLS